VEQTSGFSFSDFNAIDLVVISVVMLSMLFGVMRGFLASILSFSGWIFSVYCSWVVYPHVKDYLPFGDNPVVSTALGHIGLLIVFLILFAFSNFLILAIFVDMRKGAVDRAAGLLFGLIRGGALVSLSLLVLVIALNTVNGKGESEEEITPKIIQQAQTYQLIQYGKAIIIDLLPANFLENLKFVSENLNQKTLDDKFVDSASKRLKSSLTHKQLHNLTQEMAHDYKNHGRERAELEYLKGLVEYYKTRQRENKPIDADEMLSPKEIQRLEAIINRKQAVLEKPKEENTAFSKLD
jgi:membrane protein required for colicin V production